MGDNESPGPVHVHFVNIDDLKDQVANPDPPTVDRRTYVLLDDDAKQCSIIGDDELNASFVDRNIDTYKLDGIETWPQVPNPDKHNVILTYKDRHQTSVLIGSISLDNGPAPDQYYKSGGTIYPIDKSGASLLDATNTPNLSYIRNKYWDMARQKVQTDLMFAQIVATFAGAVSALGHAGEAGNFVTAEDIDGTVPTPAETPEDKTDSSSASADAGSGSGSGSGDSSKDAGN
jgi:hypothetical protein